MYKNSHKPKNLVSTQYCTIMRSIIIQIKPSDEIIYTLIRLSEIYADNIQISDSYWEEKFKI